jgi:signal transduction histidine kinase
VSELRGRSLRFVVAFAFLVVGLVEVYSLLLGVRAQRRLRETVIRGARAQVAAALPGLRADLGPGGADAWGTAARRALGESIAAEVEVFGMDGRGLLSQPTVSPVGHWPAGRDAVALASGTVVTVATQTGPVARALTYIPFDEGGRRLVLRLSTPVPDLERDLVERQYGFTAHLAAFSVLLLAAGLVLFAPTRPRERPPVRALDAYEEAMGRLRDRGEELSREHEEERRRMEVELREKEAMARAGELTAGIVHEVRNGLGTILGYARLLERDPASPEAAEAGPRIREECDTLETVVRRFMEFVKSETVNRASFELGRMLSRVVAREMRGRQGVRTTFVGISDGVAVVGDEELLERAFENIVRNAADAAGSGGHVSVEVGREPGAVVVTIADDGPGMPRERLQEIRPFFSSKAGGLGLGLPIAIKIVKLHGGELALGAREPHGLKVTVMLPPEGPPA